MEARPPSWLLVHLQAGQFKKSCPGRFLKVCASPHNRPSMLLPPPKRDHITWTVKPSPSVALRAESPDGCRSPLLHVPRMELLAGPLSFVFARIPGCGPYPSSAGFRVCKPTARGPPVMGLGAYTNCNPRLLTALACAPGATCACEAACPPSLSAGPLTIHASCPLKQHDQGRCRPIQITPRHARCHPANRNNQLPCSRCPPKNRRAFMPRAPSTL
jgi:hypothetical protein